VSAPAPVPSAQLEAATFLDAVRPDQLLYFLCNVGDGDAQVVVLPEDAVGARRTVVVDAASRAKVSGLLHALAGADLLAAGSDPSGLAPGAIALVVASHPHLDHIGGMAGVLEEFGGVVAELWDSGYFHTIPAYHDLMAAVERLPYLMYAQPTSGLRRWIGDVEITVLAPSVQLRNRFDTYGVEINDASISLRLEFPASRVEQRDADRRYVGRRSTQSLVLGGDAQTLSWSVVTGDFPALGPDPTAVSREIGRAAGPDALRATVLKVAHHASKHGVNLELVERVAPALTLVSSVGGGGSYGFPHTVAQGLIREALDPTTSSGREHPPDHELRVFYAADTDDAGAVLGSMAVVMGRGRWTLWRFGDRPQDPIDLGRARRWRA
jgi:competence protein ComEC